MAPAAEMHPGLFYARGVRGAIQSGVPHIME